MRRLMFSILTFLGFLLCVSHAVAQSGPGWIMSVDMGSVTPKEDRAYRMRQAASVLSSGGQAPKPNVFALSSPTSSGGVSSSSLTLGQTVGDVAELARALKADPDLVYEYVHDNISFVPNWGSKKSALGVVLDSTGNAFGQAKLMVELLRQGGMAASDVQYAIGQLTLTRSDLENLYGIELDTGLSARQQADILLGVVGGGAIPFKKQNNNTFHLSWVWVRVKINGSWFNFDPALVQQTVQSEINLDQVLGVDCAVASIKGLAASGSAAVGTNAVQNLNDQAIESCLASCATSLVDELRATNPDASLAEVIGGAAVVPISGAVIRNSQHPKLKLGTTPDYFNEIPNSYRATLSISKAGFSDPHVLYTDQLGGKRLTLSFNTSNHAELRLDGGASLKTASTAIPIGTQNSLRVSIDHNYTGGNRGRYNQRGDIPITGGSTYTLLLGWGGSGRGAVSHHRRKAHAAQLAGEQAGSEVLLGETLAVVAANFTAQKAILENALARLSNTYAISHHVVGVAGYRTGTNGAAGSPYVDIPFAFGASPGLQSAGTLGRNIFARGLYASAFESAVISQILQEFGISTVSLFELANRDGFKIFKISSPQELAYIQNQLVNYGSTNCPSSSVFCQIKAKIDDGGTIYLPSNGKLTRAGWDWQGYGYLGRIGPENTYKVGEFNGGYAPRRVPYTIVNTGVQRIAPAAFDGGVLSHTTIQSVDPVSLFTGHFLYSNDDFSIGSRPFPHGLGFKRSYSSGARHTNRGMGLGWRHNFDIQAEVSSEPFQSLGEDSAIDAASIIVAAKLTSDLLADSDTDLLNIVVASLVTHWGVDQLVDNVVTVSQPENSEQFVLLADGTYNPAPKSSSKLWKSGNEFRYETLDGIRLNFNSVGKIKEWVDANGFQVDFQYDSKGALHEVRNDFGRKLTLSYRYNNVTGVADETGRNIEFTYDSSNNLKTFTDERSDRANVTTYDYSAGHGLLTKVFMPLYGAPFVTNVYDSLGRVKEQRNAENNLYQYFFAGTRSEEIDPAGFSSVWYFNGLGGATKSIDKLSRVSTTTYDGFGRAVRSIFPEGNSVEYTYADGSCTPPEKRCIHKVKSIRTFPKSGPGFIETSFRYWGADKRYQLLWSVDGKNERTDYNSNLAGQITSLTAPEVEDENGTVSRPITRFIRESSGNTKGFLKEIIDPTGRSTKFHYDTKGNLVRREQLDSDGGPALNTCYRYNAVGDVVEVADPRYATGTCDFNGSIPDHRTGHVVYANDNRLPTQITLPDPDGSGPLLPPESSILYGLEDLQTEVREKIGNGHLTSQTRYNSLRLPEEQFVSNTGTMSLTPSVRTTYDVLDRPEVTQIDTRYGGSRLRRGVKTNYRPDGSVQSVIEAYDTPEADIVASYTYTDNGLQETVTDANGNVTTFVYDAYDRLEKIEYPGSSTDCETYRYDNNGNVLAVRRRSSGDCNLPGTTSDQHTLITTYDALNRATFVDMPSGTPDVTTKYDLAGRVKHRSVSGHATTYAHDGFGRLTQVTDDGRTVLYTYDKADNVETITWPATAQVSAFTAFYDYDPLNRLRGIYENNKNGALIASYEYDQLSRRTKITRGGSGGSTLYSYEAVRQGGRTAYEPAGSLDSITHTFGSETVGYELDYNRFGEIEYLNITNADYDWQPPWRKSVVFGAANALNQLTTVDGSALSYSAAGDIEDLPSNDVTMPQDQLVLTYDGAGRLKTANNVNTSRNATYTYGPSGQRSRTVVTNGGGGTTDHLVVGGQVLASYTGSGALLRRYIPGAGGLAPLAWYEYGGNSTLDHQYYFATDHLGSVIALVDSSNGSVVERYAYGPYGETYVGTPPNVQAPSGGSAFRYTGQLYDGETGLSYYGARYYAPSLGRFISPDPIGYGDGLNMYAYVGNNPVNYVDPTGLFAQSVQGYGSAGSGFDMLRSQGGSFPDRAPVPIGENTPSAFQNMSMGLAFAGPALAALGEGISATVDVIQNGISPTTLAAIAPGPNIGRNARPPTPASGQTVYRVYGDDSLPTGASWSPVNPGSVSNYRDAAGLPSGGQSGALNSGRFVIEGTLNDPSQVVRVRNAVPLDGNVGGVPEYIIPNALGSGAVTVNRVSGVNPEF